MPFRLRCPECGAPVRLPDERRGRKNYCPRCDARLPSRPAGGGAGWVIALVLGLAFVGLMTVAGIAVGVWYLVADKPAAPVAEGPQAAPPQPVEEPAAPAFPGPPPEAKRMDRGPEPPARNIAPEPVAPRAPGPAFPEPPEVKHPGPRVAEIKLPPTPARLSVKPPALTGRKTYPLPEAVDRAVPAGGGRFLVLHLPNLRKAGVFDVTEGKVVRFIDLPGDKPLLAAGMTKLVVYIPSAKVLRRYDLLTGRQEASKVLTVPDVNGLAMGSASAGPLVVAAADGGRLFDLDTLTEIELPADEADQGPRPGFPGGAPGPRRLPFRTERVWAAANGRLFVGASDIGGGAVALEGGQVKVKRAPGDSWMYAQPSADGKYIFRGGSGALTADGQKTQDVVYSNPDRGGFAGYFFLPAADGPYYFHVHFAGGLRGYEPRFQKDPERAVTVYMYGLDTPLARVLDLADIPDWNSVSQTGLPVNERLHLVPRANLLVTIGPARDKLTLVPLDLDQALDEAGIDFLMVTSSPPGTFTPGHEFRYPIRARSKAGGLRYALESGPDGMKVGPDGTVTWKVPAGFADGEVMVIVGLKDAGGKEAFHNFRLVKTNTPEPYVPDPEPEPSRVGTRPDARRPEAKDAGPRAPYRLPAAPARAELEPADLARRTEVRVPEKFDTVVAGGDGRFLVLHARAARKALVFDLASGAVARTVELSDPQAVLAAGMTQLFVYRPSDNTVEKVNLSTGASDGKKPIPMKGVTEMVLGSASAGPLFVRSANRAELYDAESLVPMNLPAADGFPFPRGQVWASADGRVWGNTVTRATGSFVQVAVLAADSIKVTSELVVARYAVPAADGSRVYVGGYGELTTDLKPTSGSGRKFEHGADPAYHLLPVPGGTAFLILHLGVPTPPLLGTGKDTHNGVTIWQRGRGQAAATVEVPELTADLQQEAALPSLVHYHPDAQVLAVVPPARDRVVLHPVRPAASSYEPKRAIPWRLPDVPAAPVFQPKVPAERTTYDLPGGRVSKVVVGGGGRYLVLQTDSHKLAIFDVTQGRVVREITTEARISGYAAGLTKVVLVESLPSAPVLRRYDLATGRLERSAGGPVGLESVAMGSASAGPVLGISWSSVTLYDLASLAPMTAPDELLNTLPLHRDLTAVSADGRFFAAVPARGADADRVMAFTLTKAGVRVARGSQGKITSLAVAPDGRHVFLGSQGILTADLQRAADVVYSPGALAAEPVWAMDFAPAREGPYYLHLHLGKRLADEKFARDPQFGVTVYKYGSDKPVGRLPSVNGRTPLNSEWTRFLRAPGPYHFYPSARLLVAVDPGLTKVHLIPVDPANMPALPDPDPWPSGESVPKTAPKAPRPKKDGAGAAGPVPAGKPFRLAPLPEPLPINPVTAAKSVKVGAEPEAAFRPVAKSAGGGRFILLQGNRRKIEVFDLNEAKVVRRIDLPNGVYGPWVAGMTKLVVFDTDLRGFRRFDLLTGREDLTRQYPAVVRLMAMGCASDGPVLCSDGSGLRFLDLATLELTDLRAPDLGPRDVWDKTCWASADGRAFGIGMGGVSAPQPGARVATVTLRVGPGGIKQAQEPFPSFYAVPDPTGRYLFAGPHGVYDLALGKTKDAVRSEDPSPREPPIHHYLPALDGPFYVRYHAAGFPFPGGGPPFRPVGPGGPGAPPGFPGLAPGGRDVGETGVTIYAYGQAKPVARLKDADPFAGRPPDPFSVARLADQLFLVPRAKALVVVRPRDQTIELVPVDLEAEMARSGVEVPWVTSAPPRTFKPGAEVRYPLKVVSKAGGLKYSLEDPPAGMTVSADGVLTWKPPADTPAEVRVTVRVTDAKGGESVHSFPLTRVE